MEKYSRGEQFEMLLCSFWLGKSYTLCFKKFSKAKNLTLTLQKLKKRNSMFWISREEMIINLANFHAIVLIYIFILYKKQMYDCGDSRSFLFI